ncbi:carbohydrate kinase family protein [Carboxylicivirga sp. M1479]|uniref:carbohydrate kinase family protein n=1 Tax=Carboxylicivirga sp. M1479 TaxID=2594476 RepID=UPI0011776C3A|nr:carbohydrate kinase family protein [Carboxylicivirga sp. M1479]TRX63286.1 carbohydrate kinase family protein [Carboxylicivirga sp. M1479]
MKKFDIIVTGDCNIDLLFNGFDHLPAFGEEVLAEQFNITLGSSAGITAAHLAALGMKVAYIGAIGEDTFGKQFKELMNAAGVNTDYMVDKAGFSTGCTAVLSKGEERANITHAGAMEQLCPADIPAQLLEATPFFHLSNPYVLPHFRNVLPTFYKSLKKHPIHTSLDPQWDVEEKWNTDLNELLPYVDVFLPNKTELQLLLKGNKLQTEDVQKFPNTIVCTHGNQGVAITENGLTKQMNSYINEQPQDCIGAGDAFTAGFLSAKIDGQDNTNAVEMGCRSGALSTTFTGGSVAYHSRAHFEQLFANANIKKIKH